MDDDQAARLIYDICSGCGRGRGFLKGMAANGTNTNMIALKRETLQKLLGGVDLLGENQDTPKTSTWMFPHREQVGNSKNLNIPAENNHVPIVPNVPKNNSALYEADGQSTNTHIVDDSPDVRTVGGGLGTNPENVLNMP